MTTDITAKILQSLNNLKVITDPKLEEVLKPDYELYCCAPFLLPTQASCLLAGLATMDWETLYSLIALSSIERDINKGLQAGGKLTPPKSSNGNWKFHDYVVYSFPVPHDSIEYLKNIYELIQNGTKDGSLKHTPFQQSNGTQEKLLTPEDIVKYARGVGIEIPNEMTIALEKLRSSIKILKLPKMFPNQINFGVEYYKKRIEVNQLKPVSMSSNKVVESSSESHEQFRKQRGTLTSDEKGLPLRDLIFRIANCKPRAALLNSEGIAQFKKLLIEHASCKNVLFHKTHWHPVELSLAFYGIDCYTILETMKDIKDSITSIIILVDIIQIIDGEERIFENFWNYIEAKKTPATGIGIESFTDFATEKGIQLPPHWPKPNPNSNQSKSTADQSQSEKKIETLRKETTENTANIDVRLTPRAKTLFELVYETRRSAIEIALQKQFPNDADKRKPYLALIEKIGRPAVEEFIKYKEKGSKPKKLESQHRCRAIAQLIIHLEPERKHLIKHLRQHDLMQEVCKRIINEVDDRTFSSWMNAEGIRDRKEKRKHTNKPLF